MKKTIALASALLLTSSLFVGCGMNNNAGPQTQGAGKQQAQGNRGGGMMNAASNSAPQGLSVQNMRSDRGLEKQVNAVLGSKDARVYVANNNAYVYAGDQPRDLNRTGAGRGATGTGTGAGTAGIAGTGTGAGTYGTGMGSDTYGTTGNRTGAYGTGVGDRTVTDGTGTGLFGNRTNNLGGGIFGGNNSGAGLFGNNDNNRGGLFGMGDNNRGGLFGNNDNNRGGLFGMGGNTGTGDRNGLFNVGQDNVYGINRSGTYTPPPASMSGTRAGTAGTAGTGTGAYSSGDFTGAGAARANRGTATGLGANNRMVLGTTLSDVQQTKVTQAIRTANPAIQQVYFIQSSQPGQTRSQAQQSR